MNKWYLFQETTWMITPVRHWSACMWVQQYADLVFRTSSAYISARILKGTTSLV